MADGHIVAAASTHEPAVKESIKAAGSSTSCAHAASRCAGRWAAARHWMHASARLRRPLHAAGAAAATGAACNAADPHSPLPATPPACQDRRADRGAGKGGRAQRRALAAAAWGAVPRQAQGAHRVDARGGDAAGLTSTGRSVASRALFCTALAGACRGEAACAHGWSGVAPRTGSLLRLLHLFPCSISRCLVPLLLLLHSLPCSTSAIARYSHVPSKLITCVTSSQAWYRVSQSGGVKGSSAAARGMLRVVFRPITSCPAICDTLGSTTCLQGHRQAGRQEHEHFSPPCTRRTMLHACLP